jgi:hypothetical protein
MYAKTENWQIKKELDVKRKHYIYILFAILRLEELGQLKNPVTSSGIEPATFRLVV